MKKFKKIMAVLVAAIMVVAMTVPAFAAVQKTLTYNVNGGNADGPAAETFDVEIEHNISSTEPTHEPAADGTSIVFIGWTETPYANILMAGDTTPETYFKSGAAGAPGPAYPSLVLYENKTLYALWGYDYNQNGAADVTESGTAHTITFNGNAIDGGTVTGLPTPNPITYKTGSFHFGDTVPTHSSGYVFVGWTRNANPTLKGVADHDTVAATNYYFEAGTGVDSGDFSADVTYYALWSEDTNNDGVADCLQQNVQINYSFGDNKLNVKYIVRDFNFTNTPAITNPEIKIQGTKFTPQTPILTSATYEDDVHDTTNNVAFIGWSDDPNASRTLYFPGDRVPAVYEMVTVPSNSTDAINLYAVWGYEGDGDGVADIITSAAAGKNDTAEIIAHNIDDGLGGNADPENHVAYKIFDVTRTAAREADWKQTDSNLTAALTESGGTAASGFAYTINKNLSDGTTPNPWFSVFVDETGSTPVQTEDSKTYVKVTATTDPDVFNVTWKSGYSETDANAKDFAAYLKGKVATTGDAGQPFTTGQKLYTEPGYYLITSSLGTNLVLATSSLEIKDKNKYIVDTKKIVKADATVGTNVTYFVQVYIPSTVHKTSSDTVRVHDIADENLKVDKASIWYKVFETDQTSTLTETTNVTNYLSGSTGGYTKIDNNDYFKLVASASQDHADCDFEIDIRLDYFNGINADRYVVFGYQAELRSTAEADVQYSNTEYSKYAHYTTEPTTVYGTTYDFKFTKKDASSNMLSGAVFELRTTADDPTTAMYFKRNTYYKDGNYDTETLDATSTFKGASGIAKVADTEDKGSLDIEGKPTGDVTTNLVAGELVVSGLGEGTYYLVETIAPQGYLRLEKPITIKIDDDGTTTVTYNSTGDLFPDGENPEFVVTNNTSTVLPSTGGMGTTVLYIVGGMLVILAGAYLFFARKRTA